MRTVGIIQARMRSTRLPDKALKMIRGETLLAHTVRRVNAARRLDDVIVATTTRAEDDAILNECFRLDTPTFRGSEDDVLDRYYRSSLEYRAEIVVRLTADCPVVDPAVIDRAILYFHDHPQVDYVATGRTFPEGYGTEVFSSAALKRAWEDAKLPSEREHVTPYIWKNVDRFAVQRLELDDDWSRFRLTVDEELDLIVVSTVIEALASTNPLFGLSETVAFLQQHPEIAAKNSDIVMQAGYKKSLLEDRATGPGR